MSAVAALRELPRVVGRESAAEPIAVVLLGTGLVGGALLRRLSDVDLPLKLVGVANSRHSVSDARGLAANSISERLLATANAGVDSAIATLFASNARHRVVIDATPSESIAARHAEWLAAGLHVVSANKIAQGTSAQRWQALRDAERAGSTHYGDSATVGAGLPVLATLRRLVRSGDRIRRIEGVFSGSLSFLFNSLDGTRPFSRLLADAFERGYTEPDPRADLSGADVTRKLVILARAAGFTLDPEDIAVESLVPPELASVTAGEFARHLPSLDVVMEERRVTASADGGVLRYVAEFDDTHGATVSLKTVAENHAAAQLDGADNLFVIFTDRYRERPLHVRGPGAGAEVTAQALIADVLETRGIFG